MPALSRVVSILAAATAVGLALTHSGEVRARAESALGRGMPAREAALARGFVLGEDDEVDAATVEDFRRSGLSHLLAVSGQNVALLGLLAMPLLAGLGMPLRTRLIWVLGLVAAYVPLAGAGPSILRAAVMGAMSIVATLAGRRASRLYALFVAAIVTLAIDPGLAADVGWQLSFAAVLGILLLAGPLVTLGERLVGRRGWRRALTEGAALTIAATLATAPLIAFHFGALSTTTLLANLLALPAVAPAMWLGMLVAALGQVPGLPLGAPNELNALLLAYVAQVAVWCGRPGWAYVHLRLGFAGLVGSYAVLAVAAILIRRRARLRPPSPGDRQSRLRRATRRWLAVALGVAAVVALAIAGGGGAGVPPAPPGGLRISVLDVGQGDAILLQPAFSPAVLVDGGPPGDGIELDLRSAGVDRLGAVVVTHDQADHAGGVRELLGRVPIGRLLFGRLGRSMLAEAAAAGVPARRIARGSEIASGRLRLDVLWPPAELLGEPSGDEDPNQLAVVALARWGSFAMLLTADAEAESVPLDPGPVDVLKVAHHGSDDAGLGDLLERAGPRLAVISVGAGNPFGHPSAATLATLAAHGVRVLRTDRDGAVVIDVAPRSLRITTHG